MPYALKVDGNWTQTEIGTHKSIPEEEIIFDSIKETIKKRFHKSENNSESTAEEVTMAKIDEELQSPKFASSLRDESYRYFVQTQRWIGHVEKITKNGFVAKLTDLNDNTTYEMADFEMREVSPEDRPLVSLGAAFYWSLGTVNDNGQVIKTAFMRFQRVRPWTEHDYDRIADRAQERYKKLKWN
jgi:hypothetical protein